MILGSDDGHKKVLPDIPMFGFKNNKKIHLVRSKLPDLDELDRSQRCGGKRPPCHLCENMKDTCTFKCKHLDEIYKTNKKYNCNSKMVVYLIECQISNILEVQNLSLGLGQITTKVFSKSLWAKTQFQSKP